MIRFKNQEKFPWVTFVNEKNNDEEIEQFVGNMFRND